MLQCQSSITLSFWHICKTAHDLIGNIRYIIYMCDICNQRCIWTVLSLKYQDFFHDNNAYYLQSIDLPGRPPFDKDIIRLSNKTQSRGMFYTTCVFASLGILYSAFTFGYTWMYRHTKYVSCTLFIARNI